MTEFLNLGQIAVLSIYVIVSLFLHVTDGPGFVSVISEAGVFTHTPFLIPVSLLTLFLSQHTIKTYRQM